MRLDKLSFIEGLPYFFKKGIKLLEDQKFIPSSEADIYGPE